VKNTTWAGIMVLSVGGFAIFAELVTSCSHRSEQRDQERVHTCYTTIEEVGEDADCNMSTHTFEFEHGVFVCRCIQPTYRNKDLPLDPKKQAP
jgi:hypothetical protein